MNLIENPSSSRTEASAQSAKRNGQDKDVAMAAYYIWEKEGRPQGHALDHWLRAEHKVRKLVVADQTRKPAR